MLKGKKTWLLAARLTRVRNIHKAVYSFRQPRRKSDLIPKCPQVWLQYLVNFLKKRIRIKHLQPRELEHVISKTRIVISETFSPPIWTQDLPPCYLWNADMVGDWLVSIGFSKLEECFQRNGITGRKLIRVTPKFLNQVGLRHIDEIIDLNKKVRLLLGLPQSSTTNLRDSINEILYVEYLWKRSYTGKNYDTLTFKRYCMERGFPHVNFSDLPCSSLRNKNKAVTRNNL